jgi:hypothetical protein
MQWRLEEEIRQRQKRERNLRWWTPLSRAGRSDVQWEIARTEWLRGFNVQDTDEPRQGDASVDDTTSESGNGEGPSNRAE